jgi:hypothetical protein
MLAGTGIKNTIKEIQEKIEILGQIFRIIMKISLSDRKKKLDGFDKSFGQELYVGASKEDSRLRMILSDGFDRELSLAGIPP